MFAAYIDESGTEPDQPILSIGGCIAEFTVWFEWERHWRKILQNHGVDVFHMTDFEGRHKQYKDWKNEQRLELIDDLISVILSERIWGFGGSMIKREYEEAMAEAGYLNAKGKPKEKWAEPFYFLLHFCVQELVTQTAHLPAEERIALVLDTSGYSGYARELLHKIRDEVDRNAKRLGSIDFCNVRECVPLQAADIVVFEHRKHLQNKIEKTGRPIRKSVSRLLKQFVDIRYFDKASAAEFFNSFVKAKLGVASESD
jgi:hypothetical protein